MAGIQSSCVPPLLDLTTLLFTLYATADTDNTDISEMMNWILQHKSKARDDISYLVVAASPPSVWNTKGGQKSDNTNA